MSVRDSEAGLTKRSESSGSEGPVQRERDQFVERISSLPVAEQIQALQPSRPFVPIAVQTQQEEEDSVAVGEAEVGQQATDGGDGSDAPPNDASGESAADLLGGGAGGGKASVQKAVQMDGGVAPEKVALRLMGQQFKVRLPNSPQKTCTVQINRNIGGVQLTTARLTFDDSWKLKRGTVNGSAGFSVGPVTATARVRLNVSKTGSISGSVNGVAVSEGPISGTANLKLKQSGVAGTVAINVSGDLPLAVTGGNVHIGAGSAGKVTLARGTLKKLELTRLVGKIKDGQGDLVKIEGTASYTKSAFTANGQATLVRSLSKSLGPFTFTLKQGETKGTVKTSGASIKVLTAKLSAEVTHSTLGALGTGTFQGTYKKGGIIAGTGFITLGKDVELGPNLLHAVIAKDSRVGITASANGNAAILLDLGLRVLSKEFLIATGTVSKGRYDGTKLSGGFALTFAENLSFGIGPVKVTVTSNGNMGMRYNGGADFEVDGGDLDVDAEWVGKGKLGKFRWPNWNIRAGKLGGLPSFQLPSGINFDLTSLIGWLKGFALPGGGKLPPWLMTFWERVKSTLQIDFPEFPNFLAWLGNLELPSLNGIALPGLGGGNFDFAGLLSGWWDKLLDVIGKFNLNVSIPNLPRLFEGLQIPGLDLSALTNLLNIGGVNLNLTVDGFLDWLKGLRIGGGGGLPDWVFSLWRQIKVAVPSFEFPGWAPFLEWFRGFQLNISGGTPLPSVNFGEIVGQLWGQLKALFGKFNLTLDLGQLGNIFGNLQIGGFNFDWLKKLFRIGGEGGGNKLGLALAGEIDLAVDGATFPKITGRNMSGSASWDGRTLATLRLPNMSYDGTTFTAWIEGLDVSSEFFPRMPGDISLLIAASGGISVSHTAGKPLEMTVPNIGAKLLKGETELGTGSVTNLKIGEAGLTADGDASVNLAAGFDLLGTVANSPPYMVQVQPGAQVGVDLNNDSIDGVSASNIGVKVFHGDPLFAEGRFTTLAYNAQNGFTCDGGVKVKDTELKVGFAMAGYSLEVAADLTKELTVNFTNSVLRGLGGKFSATLRKGAEMVAEGSFDGSIANIGGEGGATVTGTGGVTLGAKGLRLGPNAFHADIAGGLEVKITTSAAGLEGIDISGLSLAIATGNRPIATAKAKKAVFDGENLDGDVSATLHTPFKFEKSPVSAELQADGPISVVYTNGEVGLDGGGLGVALGWKGKGIGRLKWPSWALRIGQAFGDLPALIKDILSQLFVNVPTVDLNMAKVLAWLKKLVPASWPAPLQGLWKIILSAGNKLRGLFQGLVTLIGSLISGGGDLLGSLMTKFWELLGGLMPTLGSGGLLPKIVSWLKKLLPSGAPSWLQGLWRGIFSFGSQMGGLVSSLFTWLSGKLPLQGGVLVDLGKQLWTWLGELLPTLPRSGLLNKIKAWLKGLPTPNWGPKLSGLWDRLKGFSRYLTGMFDAALGWVMGNLPSLSGGGGFGDFLKNFFSGLLDALSNARIGPMPLSALKKLFEPMFGWLRKLKFGGEKLNVSMQTQGEFTFDLNGEDWPTVEGDNLGASINFGGKKLASASVRKMVFDGPGQRFDVWLTPRFRKTVGFQVGADKKVNLTSAGEFHFGVGLDDGSIEFTVPSITASLKKGRSEIANGSFSGKLGEAGFDGSATVNSTKPFKLAEAKDKSWRVEARTVGVGGAIKPEKGFAEGWAKGTVAFIKGDQELATGGVDVLYDGDSLNGNVTIDIAKGVSIGGANGSGWSVTAKEGTTISAHIANSALSEVKLNGTAGVAKDGEEWVAVTFDGVSYSVADGITGTIGASLSNPRTIGNPAGAHVSLPVEDNGPGTNIKATFAKNQLTAVSGNITAIGHDGEGEALVSGSLTDAYYDVVNGKFSGSANLKLLQEKTFGQTAGVRIAADTEVGATISENKLTGLSGTFNATIFKGEKDLAAVSLAVTSADLTKSPPLVTGTATVTTMAPVSINLAGKTITLAEGAGASVKITENALEEFRLKSINISVEDIHPDRKGTALTASVEEIVYKPDLTGGEDDRFIVTGLNIPHISLWKDEATGEDKLAFSVENFSINEDKTFSGTVEGTFNLFRSLGGTVTGTFKDSWWPLVTVTVNANTKLLDEKTWFQFPDSGDFRKLFSFYLPVFPGAFIELGLGAGFGLGNNQIDMGFTGSITGAINPEAPRLEEITLGMTLTGGIWLRATLGGIINVVLGIPKIANLSIGAALQASLNANTNKSDTPTASGEVKWSREKGLSGKLGLGIDLSVGLSLAAIAQLGYEFFFCDPDTLEIARIEEDMGEVFNWQETVELPINAQTAPTAATGDALMNPAAMTSTLGTDMAAKEPPEAQQTGNAEQLPDKMPVMSNTDSSKDMEMDDSKHIAMTLQILGAVMKTINSFKAMLSTAGDMAQATMKVANLKKRMDSASTVEDAEQIKAELEEATANVKNMDDAPGFVDCLLALQETLTKADKKGTLKWLKDKLPWYLSWGVAILDAWAAAVDWLSGPSAEERFKARNTHLGYSADKGGELSQMRESLKFCTGIEHEALKEAQLWWINWHIRPGCGGIIDSTGGYTWLENSLGVEEAAQAIMPRLELKWINQKQELAEYFKEWLRIKPFWKKIWKATANSPAASAEEYEEEHKEEARKLINGQKGSGQYTEGCMKWAVALYGNGDIERLRAGVGLAKSNPAMLLFKA